MAEQVLDRDLVLPHIVRRTAEENGDRVFFQPVEGQAVTYAEVLAASYRWASVFARLGIGRGDRVLTMVPNRVEAYEIWLGLSWLGAIEVGLNTAYRGQMLRYTAEAAQARMIVIAEQFLDRLAPVAAELDGIEAIVVPDATDGAGDFPRPVLHGAELLAEAHEVPELHTPEPWDTACVIWTSGTTGPSKPVMVPWGELYELCAAWAESVEQNDALYHYCPYYHLSGKFMTYLAALTGVPAVMREVFSAGNFWSDVRRHRITVALMVEAIARILMAAPARPDDSDNPLRAAIITPVFAEIPEFVERFGMEGFGTWYGMSEIGPPICSDGFKLENLESCGRLREGYEVLIADKHDYPVADGEVGELLVRSKHPWKLNSGYFGMPDVTLQAWRNGWFHTGDGFRRDPAGNFYFVDRMKDAIRRRGENISSFEVEAAVNEHSAVAESAAVAVPSEYGEDEVKIVVVLAPDARLTERDLVAWLTDHLPRFMLPRFVEFVKELPKTKDTLRTQKAVLRQRGITSGTWDREHPDGTEE
ncbi:AMP-binding protein [Streptomyces justiciae]|uniref:AMP-binding protein n=1 Tax=Streptomyces justiciae TaxID=2780140 RepID=UPI0021178A2A|nr:AMP-binding protein [Streptomyces justiciae]MCW8379730.1 AMP-binding protein [Streptomyces justiciae]